MRPPENRDHSTAFAIIFGAMCLITALWTAWVVQAKMATVADEVRPLRVNP